MNRLSDFAKYKKTSFAAVEAFTTSELDSFLSLFYASLRKQKDGATLYTKKSMQAIRYGLMRYFLKSKGFNICKDVEFDGSNKTFKAMLVKLKDAGKGWVKRKSRISTEDMAKIQASKELDMNTPLGLQNKVFVDVMIYFCNRGRENLRSMKPSDFTISRDAEGIKYVIRRDQLTKNNREDDDGSTNGFMYEIPGYDRYPVASLEKYISKLNPACEVFWQKPKEIAPVSGSWYCNAPVGVNTLGDKMKVISTGAKCSKVYTNHCLRATCVSTLDDAGFANRDIMSVSGHHSEHHE